MNPNKIYEICKANSFQNQFLKLHIIKYDNLFNQTQI